MANRWRGHADEHLTWEAPVLPSEDTHVLGESCDAGIIRVPTVFRSQKQLSKCPLPFMVCLLTVRGEVDTGAGAGGGGGGGGPGSSPVPPPNLFKKRVGDGAGGVGLGGPRASLVPPPRWRSLLWSLLRAGVAAVAGRRAPSERDVVSSGPPASPHAPALAWSCVRSHMAVSVAGSWPPVVALYSFHDGDSSSVSDVLLPDVSDLPRKVAVEVGRLHCPASAVDITSVAWTPFLADAVAVGTR